MTRALVMKTGDNVATVLAEVQPGERVGVADARQTWAAAVIEPLDLGHKFALRAISAGDPIVKYGEVIGYATRDIAAGAHVHVHNMASGRARRDDLEGAGNER